MKLAADRSKRGFTRWSSAPLAKVVKCSSCKRRLRNNRAGWFIRRDENGRVTDCVCPNCVRGR